MPLSITRSSFCILATSSHGNTFVHCAEQDFHDQTWNVRLLEPSHLPNQEYAPLRREDRISVSNQAKQTSPLQQSSSSTSSVFPSPFFFRGIKENFITVLPKQRLKAGIGNAE